MGLKLGTGLLDCRQQQEYFRVGQTFAETRTHKQGYKLDTHNRQKIHRVLSIS